MSFFITTLVLWHSHGEDVQGINRRPDNIKVGLQDGDGPRKSLMSTATEERHPGIQQDGRDQRGVGYPTQTFEAAFRTPWEQEGMKRLIKKINNNLNAPIHYITEIA